MRSLEISIFAMIILVSVGAYGDVVELYWDDGIPYVPHFYTAPGNGYAVRFVTDGACLVYSVRVYIANPPGETDFDQCELALYYDQNGFPADEPFWGKQTFDIDLEHEDWFYFTVNTTNEESIFYVAWFQLGTYPHCDGVYSDSGEPVYYQSFVYFNGEWSYFPENSDLLIRCTIDTEPAVQPTSLGWLKSLLK